MSPWAALEERFRTRRAFFIACPRERHGSCERAPSLRQQRPWKFFCKNTLATAPSDIEHRPSMKATGRRHLFENRIHMNEKRVGMRRFSSRVSWICGLVMAGILVLGSLSCWLRHNPSKMNATATAAQPRTAKGAVAVAMAWAGPAASSGSEGPQNETS